MMLRKANNTTADSEWEIAELKRGMQELGIAFDQKVLDKFMGYLQILYSYHGKMHLMSHRDYKRISRQHFLPSLLILEEISAHKRVCDVGSGAGFPSVPLKILSPYLELVIFEAQRKKADFLKKLIEKIGLGKVEIVNARAEAYSGSKFDLALLRAVGKIRKLTGVLDTLLEPGGEAIFLKSPGVEKEIDEAQRVLHERNFQVSIRKTLTPLDKSPLALVILRKM